MSGDNPPLKNARLDRLEHMLQHTEDEMLVSAYHRKDDTWVRAGDIRSMIAELRRRRRKMGYTEK